MKEILLSGALIAAVVEVLKRLGLPQRYVKPAVVVVSAVLYTLAAVTEMWPETAGYVDTGLQVLLVILASMGLYDAGLKPIKTWLR